MDQELPPSPPSSEDAGQLQHRPGRKLTIDVGLAIAMAIIAGMLSFRSASLAPPTLRSIEGYDIWFEADVPRVVEDMCIREGDHYRTNVHPLFPLAAFGLVQGTCRLFGTADATAVNMVIAFVAALWAMTLYAVLRAMSCVRLDAAVFTLLGMASAAAVFWFSVPETYSFGSLSILLAALLVAWDSKRARESWLTAVGVLTWSFTLTNAMAGVAAAIVRLRWRRAIQACMNSFCLVVILWGVQKFFFRLSEFFLDPRTEAVSMLRSESGGAACVTKAFLFHSVIMPKIVERNRGRTVLSVQRSSPGSAGALGRICVGLWAILLLGGVYGLFAVRSKVPIRLFLVLVLLGQLGLHMLYGEETFLYSLHFAPLLVIFAALGSLTRARLVVLGAATLLTIAIAINNFTALAQAMDWVSHAGSAPPP